MSWTDTKWTDKEDRQVKELWGLGWSTNAIAGKMRRSKNSIVGRVHRLNLPGRPSPIKKGDGAPKPPSRVGKAPTLPPLVAAPVQAYVERQPMWTVDRDAVLYDGWCKGVPAQDLHRAINALPGVMVAMDRLPIRASRLGLKRPVQFRPGGSTSRPISSVSRPVMEIIPAPRQVARPVAVLNLNAACCWPIGTPKTADFRFCDAPPVKGKSYCPDHCARAFTSLPADRAPRVIIAGGMRVTV